MEESSAGPCRKISGASILINFQQAVLSTMADSDTGYTYVDEIVQTFFMRKPLLFMNLVLYFNVLR